MPTRSSFKKDISYLFVPFFIASLFNKAKNKRKSSGLWTAKTHYTSGNRRPKKKGASCAPPTAVPCEHSGRRSTSGKLQGPQRGQRSPPGCALKGQTASQTHDASSVNRAKVQKKEQPRGPLSFQKCKKEEQPKPLNFYTPWHAAQSKSPKRQSLRVVRCGQIVRSSRLTLNKSP